MIEINFSLSYKCYAYFILQFYCVVKIIIEIEIWRKLNQFKKYDNFGIYYELKKHLEIVMVYSCMSTVGIAVFFMFYLYTLFLAGTHLVCW